jgi:hypothetical protein
MIKALITVCVLTLPSLASAQAFKVAKFSIGGDGGTDYLTAVADRAVRGPNRHRL